MRVGLGTLAGLKLMITEKHWKSRTLEEEINSPGDEGFVWGEKGEHELSIKYKKSKKEKQKERYCKVSIRVSIDLLSKQGGKGKCKYSSRMPHINYAPGRGRVP